ncbi:MAG: isoprenylcysteine carboxylmethyltransferase family protein [Candidatus Omnitrophota bacterium]
MALREEFEKIGSSFFKLRSYLPLLMAALFLIALRNFAYPAHRHDLDRMWEIGCLVISLFGFGIRLVTVGYAPKGTSGRGTHRPTAEVLNTTGMYSLIRHPLYLGNFFIWFGIVLSVRSFWFSLAAVLAYWLYYEKIMFMEEEFLRRKFGELFEKWSGETPAILPNFKRWRSPQLHFSFKKAVGKECSAPLGIISAMAVLDIIGDRVAEGRFEIDLMWFTLFVASLLTYLTILTLRKKTKLLDAGER